MEVVAGFGRAARMDGRPEECCFSSPQGIAVHEPSRSCFVVEHSNHVVRRVAFVNDNLSSSTAKEVCRFFLPSTLSLSVFF